VQDPEVHCELSPQIAVKRGTFLQPTFFFGAQSILLGS
jgi:hypothetical protein